MVNQTTTKTEIAVTKESICNFYNRCCHCGQRKVVPAYIQQDENKRKLRCHNFKGSMSEKCLHGHACFRLARIMAKGRAYNIEWNIETAIDYLEKAANQGVLEAGLSLLALYRDGIFDRGQIRFRNWAKYHALLASLYHANYLPAMLELYHGVNLGIYAFPQNKDLADIILQKILSTKLNINKLIKIKDLCIFQEQFDIHEKQAAAMKLFINFARRRYVIEKCPDSVIGIGKYPW